MMMMIAVYAVTGATIAVNRWVRLTGAVNADGAYEVDVVGAGHRAHALLMPHPKGAVTAAIHGYAHCLGPIQTVEAGSKVVSDDDLSPNPDGTVTKSAKGDKHCVGVAITSGAKGAIIHMMIRYAGRP